MSPGPQLTLSNWEELGKRPSITVGPHWEMTTQALVGMYPEAAKYTVGEHLGTDFD
jgi:hypothetical protein